MSGTVGAHNELHSEQGARRVSTPVEPAIRSSRSPTSPGSSSRSRIWIAPRRSPAPSASPPSLRTPDELQLRGSDAGAPCVLLRRGDRSRFVGTAFTAQSTRSTCCGWPTPPARPCETTPRIPRRHLASTWSTRAVSPSGWSRACTSCPSCARQRAARLQRRTPTRAHQRHAAPAAGAGQAFNGSATSCCRPPGTPRHSTGTSTTSG